jgi:5-methylthioadenosine/S-adenosylhomocysteine deaminase
MTLMRGYADDMKLQPWLEEKIWPLEDHLEPEDVYWGTLLACVEQLRGGITTFADMYFFMDDVARAVAESGIRASLSRGLIGFEDKERSALQEGEELHRRWHGRAEERITIWLGPHAPYTCPPDYLRDVVALAEKLNTGLHMHLAETRGEVEDLEESYGKTPIELAAETGLLDQRVLAAHCVHLNENDIYLLSQATGGVAHNPVSNMKLASGAAPVPALKEAGVNVGLGTDGASSTNRLSMFTELRTAALLQKHATADPTQLSAEEVVWMSTRGGAEILGLKDVGRIEPGAIADIVLVDLDRPHLTPHHDVLSLLAYSAEETDVDSVFVNGRPVVRDGQVLTCDVERILVKARACAQSLVERAGQ